MPPVCCYGNCRGDPLKGLKMIKRLVAMTTLCYSLVYLLNVRVYKVCVCPRVCVCVMWRYNFQLLCAGCGHLHN